MSRKDTVLRILIVVGVLYTALLVVMIIFFSMSIHVLSGLRISYENTTRKPDTISDEIEESTLKKYSDETYNFSLYYPSEFQIEIDDAWENSILIFNRKGNQSYDLVVQVWDSINEYENIYQSEILSNQVIVKSLIGKYFTFNNVNNTEEVTNIINSVVFNAPITANEELRKSIEEEFILINNPEDGLIVILGEDTLKLVDDWAFGSFFTSNYNEVNTSDGPSAELNLFVAQKNSGVWDVTLQNDYEEFKRVLILSPDGLLTPDQREFYSN